MPLEPVILIDIEGTISDIAFVKEVLFPYSAKHLRDFCGTHRESTDVESCLSAVMQTLKEESAVSANEADALEALERWIREDRKHPALKELQGLIWKQGFEAGDFRSHLYKDVVPTLKQWKAEGKRLAIYSSGSKGAQELFFQYTEEGDIRHLFEAFFDLQMGSKLEGESYHRIAKELGVSPCEILFLSDRPGECEAAQKAGCAVRQAHRPGIERDARFTGFASLAEI